MERVAFLLERTNERLVSLLNPESLIIRRVAGIRPRQSAGGQLTGNGLYDDPLLYTGGGRTELELELLFDVSLAGSTLVTDDVRDLTAPLWSLAENTHDDREQGYPPLVRFIWGKFWNIPGVISAVSERLEEFTAEGAPQRSWLKMRMLRVRDPRSPVDETNLVAGAAASLPETMEDLDADIPIDRVRYHEIIEGERLDEIAFRYYGYSGYWRLLASFNNLSDALTIPGGFLLVIPPAPMLVLRLLTSYGEVGESSNVSFTSLLRLSPLSPLRIQL